MCFFVLIYARDHMLICVDNLRALSRSAQYWSSYSGYLREVRECCSYDFDVVGWKIDFIIFSTVMFCLSTLE